MSRSHQAVPGDWVLDVPYFKFSKIMCISLSPQLGSEKHELMFFILILIDSD